MSQWQENGLAIVARYASQGLNLGIQQGTASHIRSGDGFIRCYPDYTYAIDTLDAYDYQSLKIADTGGLALGSDGDQTYVTSFSIVI